MTQSPKPLQPHWKAVTLVCKDCRKRGNGPKKKQAKETLSAIRLMVKQSKPRTRLVLTSCMGLCPKSAVAVVSLPLGDGARVLAVESSDQVS